MTQIPGFRGSEVPGFGFAGTPVDRARGVVVLAHGRNAGPENILDLVPRLNVPDLAYLAPAAANRTWYPYSFMAEREKNEPSLSSALALFEETVVDLLARGIDERRIYLAGFSQGACLTSEFAARHPRRYGGVIAFTGGLIGAPGTTWEDVERSFDGMPAFFGSSDVDAHVPESRVHETAEVYTRMGADVTIRIYPSMGHLVNEDEIQEARKILFTGN